jgi:hypothetical protein
MCAFTLLALRCVNTFYSKRVKDVETFFGVADEAEYMRQQQLWLQAFPPTQKHEIQVQHSGSVHVY